MLNAPANVHPAPVIKDDLADRAVPFTVRALALLSTTRWRPDRSVHPDIAAAARSMEAAGWMIRGAWQRNYIVWRSGDVARSSRLPLLVLPLAFGRLSPLHVNVFLATEMALAQRRAAGGGTILTEAETAKLLRLCKAVSIGSGTAVIDPRRIHRDAARSLERTVGAGWA